MNDVNANATDVMSKATEALGSLHETIDSIQRAIAIGFTDAVQLIADGGSIITSGLGKSGFIARKMSATLASLRFKAHYVHPVDALHGDAGVMSASDVVVVFSKSGETPEIIRFVNQTLAVGAKVIAITARNKTSLGSLAHCVCLAPFDRELDELNLVPTSSTTSALIVADLLAVCAAELNGGISDRLQASHPDGAIGSSLLRTVEDVMHVGVNLPLVAPDMPLTKALIELTTKALGVVCVVDSDLTLRGVITDGDVRRIVASGADVASVTVSEVMTSNPVVVSPKASLHDALMIMEKRDRQIGVLPVVQDGICVGVIRVHDAVKISL